MIVDYKLIGERIRAARLKKGLTQVTLSEMMDISVVFLSRIERGSSNINLKRLMEICQFLEVSPGELLLGVSPDNKNYLDKDFSDILQNCNGEKQRLIYEIAKLVESVNV